MNRIKRFFEDLKSSFHTPDFYSAIRGVRTLSDGVFNLAIAGIIIGIGAVVSIFVFIFPEASYTNITTIAKEVYPAELVVTIDNGILSTNLPGPYIVPIEGEDFFQEDNLSNFLVIDTSEGVVVDDIDRYKTFVLITSDRIISREDITSTREGVGVNSSIKITKFQDIEHLVISTDTLASFLEKIKPVYYTLLFIVPFLIISFFTVATIASYMVFALLGALVVLIVSNIRSLHYSYGEAYITSLYALLPILVYDLVTDLLGFGNLFSIGALLFIAIVLLNLNKEENLS